MAQQARRAPETTHDIKLKTNSRQAGKLTVLTFSNLLLISHLLRTQRQTTSMFHMQLVVSRIKKQLQQQQQYEQELQKQKGCQQQQLATGNWLTLKGSTSQVRNFCFVLVFLFVLFVLFLLFFCCCCNCCYNCRRPESWSPRPAQSSILITYAIYLLPYRKYCAIVCSLRPDDKRCAWREKERDSNCVFVRVRAR